MKTPGNLLIFEDDPAFGSTLTKEVRRRVGKAATVTLFESHLNRTRGETFEDRLKAELGGRPQAQVSLWVSDRDLSSTPSFTGFSESAVSRVANEWAIPVCLYARGSGNALLDRQRNWAEGRIILDASHGEREMGRQIGIIYSGFSEIGTRLRRILSSPRSSKESRLTPARMLARMLGKPEVADKLAMYGTGDQKMLADLLPFKGKQIEPRIPRLLGYWLLDSVNSPRTQRFRSFSLRHFMQVLSQMKIILFGGDPTWMGS
jgi:hypothetical protein